MAEEGTSDEETYRGIPLSELEINSVDWTHRAEHIRTRSDRYGPGEFNVEPEWATEAATDDLRLIATTGGASIEVVGWSKSAPSKIEGARGRVLKVWIVPKDVEAGDWWGASACEGNGDDRKAYASQEEQK